MKSLLRGLALILLFALASLPIWATMGASRQESVPAIDPNPSFFNTLQFHAQCLQDFTS